MTSKIDRILRQLEQQLAQSEQPLDLRLVNDEPMQHLDTHLKIMQTFYDLLRQPSLLDQRPLRKLEHLVRLRAVQHVRQVHAEHTWDEIAQTLGISARTLRDWDLAARQGDLQVQPIGRSLITPTAEQCGEVWHYLHDTGPGVGVPTLCTRFASLSRAALTEIIQLYRQLWQAEHTLLQHRLQWLVPGTVWAMDFSEAPGFINGQFHYLLAARDLASGMTLAWEPVVAPTAAVTLCELEMLFTIHGAPLVLKMDNGPAFIAEEVRRLLDKWDVIPLYSPARTPTYNGSIEAAIGALKARTQQHADQAGHAELWTSADIEAARLLGNATPRRQRLGAFSLTTPPGFATLEVPSPSLPDAVAMADNREGNPGTSSQGGSGTAHKGLLPVRAEERTPDEVWDQRSRLTREQRAAFQATVASCRAEAKQEMDLFEDDLTRGQQAAIDRKALPRALGAHALLLYRRRRIPAPIRRPKLATRT